MARFQSCLIVTYGRSGSTLMQGILNTIEGWLIRGENEHFAVHLFHAHQALHRAVTGPYAGDSTAPNMPWYGLHEVDLAVMRADCAGLIRHVLVPPARDHGVRCFGFKEIRYLFEPDELREYLDFLHDVLPDLGVVFNFRDHDQVLRSGWWAGGDAGATRALLNRFERAALGYHVDGRAPSCIVRYEEILRRGAALAGLFGFLDEAMDQARLDRVFATVHSTVTAGHGDGGRLRRVVGE
ncbi:hypothetical protein [Acidiphilium sp.]|uniref:hypothetical protein n=1 Tax=Acidiphilium sp. TaxID=527 RepID=UPI003D04AF77